MAKSAVKNTIQSDLLLNGAFALEKPTRWNKRNE